MKPRGSSRPLLATIKIPTLVIVGNGDTLIAPDEGREIAAGIPAAKLREVENAGHMCIIEQPETVTKLLKDFFD